MVERIAEQGGVFSRDAMSAIPDAFYAANGISVDAAATEIANALDGYEIAQALSELITVDEIDTFARAKEIPAGDVIAISRPLNLPESQVKVLLAEIIGEPFVEKDWGGEFDDLFSDRVLLRGRRTSSSFILKGPARQGTLTLAKLGTNGDQLDRMLNQPSQLFVVQHCDQISTAVRRHLRRGIIALRAMGTEGAVGSVWDGNDTARLLVAYGMIDRETGHSTSQDGARRAGRPSTRRRRD